MLNHINRVLFPVKAHYFLYNAATGPLVQFQPTIARQLGFSSTLAGAVFLILPILGLIARPIFCGIADKFNLHKAIFIIFQVILALGFLVMYFIPEMEPSAKATLLCHDNIAFLQIPLDNKLPADVKSHEYKNNTYINCELSCEASTLVYKHICDEWHVAKYCSHADKEIPQNGTFDFNGKFDMYKEIPIEDEWNLRLVNITFDDANPRIVTCKNELKTTCHVKCEKDPYLTRVIMAREEEKSFSYMITTYQFHLFLFATIVSWVGMSIVVSIADMICFTILGEDKSNDYGKQRFWGGVGFGIFGISAGYLIDVFSTHPYKKDYSCIFYIMVVAMIGDVIASIAIKMKQKPTSEGNPSIVREIFSIGKEPGVLVFCFWCIGAGMCTGVIWFFLFWYTEEIADDSQRPWIKTVQGLITGVQCFLGEMPFNFVSGMILKKLGHVNVMSLVLLAYAVRFMAYSMISNIWIFLIFEILHGPSYGLCWPAMVSYGEKVSPPGTKATIQGLVGAIFEGIGVSLGSLVCGNLIDTYKGVTTFRIFSGGALVWLAIYWILQMMLRRTKSYPLSQGHSRKSYNLHASYMPPDDALLMTMSQEMTTY